MSYWTDWYIAEEADVAQFADGDPNQLPRLTLDSIIQTDLDDLAELLGAEYIASMELINEDPMVVTVPRSFVVALGNLADAEINDIAQKWAAADEMGVRGSLELNSVLDSMRKFCTESMEAGKNIIERPA